MGVRPKTEVENMTGHLLQSIVSWLDESEIQDGGYGHNHFFKFMLVNRMDMRPKMVIMDITVFFDWMLVSLMKVRSKMEIVDVTIFFDELLVVRIGVRPKIELRT